MTHRILVSVAAVSLLLTAAAASAAESTASMALPSNPSALCGEPKEEGKDKTPNPSALCGEPK
ncbi:MAG: hypothetical protein JW751_28535, partial [Polyangiaceae bacterium]|nr:hypothetical protein [Polyangiaceae bacterium]